MARTGNSTKETILDVAESLVMEHGFGATSIDQILERTGVTKGAFFHHFRKKSDLALALIDRYVQRDDALLHDLMAKAENLSRDPLQQMLIFIGLLHEFLAGLESPHPGCMIASFIYQFEEFTPDTQTVIVTGFDEWHRVLDSKFRSILEKYPARSELSATDLVDNFLAQFEGGMILAKMMSRPSALAAQIHHYRTYIELLFDQN